MSKHRVVLLAAFFSVSCSAGGGTTGGGHGRHDGGGSGIDSGTHGMFDGGPFPGRDAHTVPPIDGGPCSAIAVEAMPGTRPVDIIWAIDNSGSMDREEEIVQTNMNSFAGMIGGFGIDYHVIV